MEAVSGTKLSAHLRTQMLLQFLVASILIIGIYVYYTRESSSSTHNLPEKNNLEDTRSITYGLESSNKKIIILYGSQTGTAEDYARRLAHATVEDFSIPTIVGDMEDYDALSIREVALRSASSAEPLLICFVLATYGDGEPTDNATAFYEELCGLNAEADSLAGLSYLVFGLGNTTYEKYNFMARSIDEHLQRLGAKRVGERGEGDDGMGTLDEDFLAWKDLTLKEVATLFGTEKAVAHFTPLYEVKEVLDTYIKSEAIYLGERNEAQIINNGLPVRPFNAKNPYLAPITYSKQLFAPTCGRHCLHLEFDVAGTNLTYNTGDHLGVWPINPEVEVERLLTRLGLLGQQVITMSPSATSSGATVIPEPTTYETILRHRLEICGKVSREICGTLSQFAPNEDVKASLLQLAEDRYLFQETVASRHLNFGQFLELLAGEQSWPLLPFSYLLTTLSPLQPRFYSISSSSHVSPVSIHITAAVKDEIVGSEESNRFRGLTTNYLKSLIDSSSDQSLVRPEYEMPSLRIDRSMKRVGIYVRQSKFRLPPSSQTPIIMIGPGTGVAPFRAFLQDRALAKERGVKVGRTFLFTGCRNRNEDYIYSEEWEKYKTIMGDDFQLHTAFSREGSGKVYVQHLMTLVQAELFHLLDEARAWVYICGDASRMAKDVQSTFTAIIASAKSITREDAGRYMTRLKDNGRMHVSNSTRECWPCFPLPISGWDDMNANDANESRKMYGKYHDSAKPLGTGVGGLFAWEMDARERWYEIQQKQIQMQVQLL